MTLQANYKDFNNAEPSNGYSLIPASTIAQAVINLRPGNYGEDNLLTKNERTGSIGLNVEFTITKGEFKGRKIFQLIGIEGHKKDDLGNDIWGSMGRKLIRSILESAHNIAATDSSDKATRIRKIDSYNELNNLNCLIKIGVEEDKTGQYSDKNKVLTAITIDHSEYSQPPEKSAPIEQRNVDIGKRSMKDTIDPLDDAIPF